MAFNKVLVGLLPLIVAASIANARVDFLSDSSLLCCQNCQCDESAGHCTCKDKRFYIFPPGCSDCQCTPPRPVLCHCNDKLKSCPPKCVQSPPPALKALNSIQF